jgi:uncharacterized protein YecT (DUF1311 family)
MKRTLIILILTFSINCFAQTQAEMNKEAYRTYKKADKELNSVYKNILTEYKSDSIFVENLKKSQRIWIEFRDAELKMKYPERRPGFYGTIHPICRAMYLEELTETRTKTLKQWLKGIESLEACNGSIKINK